MSAVPRIGIQPAPFEGTVSMCSVSGPAVGTDGTPLVFGTVTFDSRVPQVVAHQLIQPVIVSADTDERGQFAISLPQGLVLQATISDHGVTYPPVSVVVPMLSHTTFDQLLVLEMPTGVPEAPQHNGPWGRMGSNFTWVPVPTAPSQASGNLAYSPATNSWVTVYGPGVTDPAGAVSYPGGHVLGWDPDTNQWCQVYLPAVTMPPASNALAWDSNTSSWVETVWAPPTTGWAAGTYGWYTDGVGHYAWIPVATKSGVVDGSQATAGQIGELAQANNQVNALASVLGSTNYTTIAQMTLQPGDWDISALVSLTPVAASAAAMMMGWAYFSTVTGAPNMGPGNYILLSNAFEGGTTNVGPQQFNITVATTLYLTAWIASPNAADNNLGVIASAFLHARRMR